MSIPIHKRYLSARARDRHTGPGASFILDQLSLPPSKKSPSSLPALLQMPLQTAMQLLMPIATRGLLPTHSSPLASAERINGGLSLGYPVSTDHMEMVSGPGPGGGTANSERSQPGT